MAPWGRKPLLPHKWWRGDSFFPHKKTGVSAWLHVIFLGNSSQKLEPLILQGNQNVCRLVACSQVTTLRKVTTVGTFSPRAQENIGRSQGPTCLSFSLTGITSTHHLPHAAFIFEWILGIKLRSCVCSYLPDTRNFCILKKKFKNSLKKFKIQPPAFR